MALLLSGVFCLCMDAPAPLFLLSPGAEFLSFDGVLSTQQAGSWKAFPRVPKGGAVAPAKVPSGPARGRFSERAPGPRDRPRRAPPRAELGGLGLAPGPRGSLRALPPMPLKSGQGGPTARPVRPRRPPLPRGVLRSRPRRTPAARLPPGRLHLGRFSPVATLPRSALSRVPQDSLVPQVPVSRGAGVRGSPGLRPATAWILQDPQERLGSRVGV